MTRAIPLLKAGTQRITGFNQSELAHFGQISTTRMTQIMWFDNLAPEIQERIHFLPRTTQGRDSIKEADIRPIAKTLDRKRQRKMWKQMKTTVPLNPLCRTWTRRTRAGKVYKPAASIRSLKSLG